jgi:hypothetical protein
VFLVEPIFATSFFVTLMISFAVGAQVHIVQKGGN